ncbi:uncharacterized protein K452DRAFT_20115 [Aplosporella prunicola CBS 121167]|uniref:BTB domain-containing protein n=1 Tax=Aplosporella prunicola CBS 121167 TaxID=1176127 RepID=A0A6A6BED4_9PEZI|nr:uncharacterized protein K452DRAFT_20115 [Aplosporella prunicola CBS 121167]KAF2142520.1 hypothetical protein K452DRAFT_20115 [Aplosporella prunicola CBS 121167]
MQRRDSIMGVAKENLTSSVSHSVSSGLRKLPCFWDNSISEERVIVRVGIGGQVFRIHRDVLCQCSPNFRAALQGNFREATEGLVLEDVSVDTFKVFLDWAYMGTVPDWPDHSFICSCKCCTADKSSCVHDEATLMSGDPVSLEALDLEAHYRTRTAAEIMDAYIFAYQYDIRHYRNDLFDAIHAAYQYGDSLPSYSIVLKAFEHMAPSSPVCRYLIDVYARNYDRSSDDGHRHELIIRRHLPNDFLLPLLLKKMDGCDEKYTPWDEDYCRYHEHSEGEKGKCWWQNKDTKE